MAPKKSPKKPRKGKAPPPPKKGRHEPDVLDSLTADEARTVLQCLMEDDPDLRLLALETSLDLITDIDPDEVAIEVASQLDGLRAEDAYARAGTSRHGYLGPGDWAWRMFEDALEPFLKRMRRLQGLEKHAKAREYCIGILRGIRQFEEEKGFDPDFMDLAADAPGTCFEDVLAEWRKGVTDKAMRKEMDASLRSEFPGWTS